MFLTIVKFWDFHKAQSEMIKYYQIYNLISRILNIEIIT